MIVASMSACEMYEEFMKDSYKIKIKEEKYKVKAIKELKRLKIFPNWVCYDYFIPSSHNTYTIYFYADNEIQCENPKSNHFAIVYFENKRFVVKWGCTPYRNTGEKDFICTRRIDAYTCHFLQRYNERVLKHKEYSDDEIACRFLSKNPTAEWLHGNKDILSNIESYGANGQQCFLVNEGLCLHRFNFEYEDDSNEVVRAMTFVYTTFVSKKMLSEHQSMALNDERKNFWKKLFDEV